MVESDDVAPGNVLGIMQKGYTLNGRTYRAAGDGNCSESKA